jgi:hypothetical protein
MLTSLNDIGDTASGIGTDELERAGFTSPGFGFDFACPARNEAAIRAMQITGRTRLPGGTILLLLEMN